MIELVIEVVAVVLALVAGSACWVLISIVVLWLLSEVEE